MNFSDFCLDHGVIPPSDLVPGRWTRCSTVDHPNKKGRSGNGTVKLSDDERVGWVRNWATMETPAMWKANGDRAQADDSAFKARSAERFREQVRLEKKAMEDARKYFLSCPLLSGPTPYMEAKEITVQGAGSCRRTGDGALVIPMTIEKDICSTQTIFPDGSKKFFYGAPVKGATFTMGRKDSAVTLLCEGWATGATLHAAVPEALVIVCFSASNLVTVARKIKLHGMACICADDDWETCDKISRNPGVDAAKEAAEILGCGVAKPECSGSDFNDLFRECLRKLREDDMLSKFKKQPDQIRQNALAEVKRLVMKSIRFIPYPQIT